nr:CrcB family protein [Actinomyces bowdenii]
MAAVGLGGACGCLLRAGLGGQVPTTLAINLLGALALGVLLGALGQHHRLLRLALGTGLLGGLTTHSTYIIQSQQLLAQGRLLLGAAHLLGAFTAGLAAAGLGLWLGGLLQHHDRGGRGQAAA